MIIDEYLNKVKPKNFEEKDWNNIAKLATKEMAYKLALDKSQFEEIKSEYGFTYHRLKPFKGDSLQNRCSNKTIAMTTKNPTPKKETKRKQKDYSKVFPELFGESYDFRKDYKPLQNAFKRYVDSWGWLKKEFDGVFRAFLVSEKGTPAYSRKMYWRVHDFAAKCDKKYKYKTFHTFTMRQRKYKGNIKQAWIDFSEALTNYCKYIQRYILGDYIIALEAHESGMPHAHAIFYTNVDMQNPEEEFDIKKGTFCLTHGALFNLDAQLWQMGMTVIKVNNRESTENYLAKYLSKFEDEYFLELAKKEKWTPTERKAVATMFLPKIYRVREFRFSQAKFEEEPSIQEMCQDEFSTVSKDTTAPSAESYPKEKGLEVADFQTLLKSLWNKSPFNCSQELFLWSTKDFKLKGFVNPKQLEDLPHAKNHYFGKMGRKISCSGCLDSEIAKWIWEDDGKIFLPVKNWEALLSLIPAFKLKGDFDDVKAMCRSTSNEEMQQYYSIMKDKLLGNIPEDEIFSFLCAVYSTNPLLYRLVFPKHWINTAEHLSHDTREVKKDFSQGAVIFIRNMFAKMFNIDESDN